MAGFCFCFCSLIFDSLHTPLQDSGFHLHKSCFSIQLINLAGDADAGNELELELIQTQMAQKPMLRAEVGMRVRCANKASAE